MRHASMCIGTCSAALVALTAVVGHGEAAADKAAKTGKLAKAADDTWISLTGTVVKSSPDAFRLDTGKEVVTVEMDDFDFYAEGRNLMTNDRVVVVGKVDDGLFERKKVEASSVYVENLNTHFYANAADEEDFSAWTVTGPLVVGDVELTGTVASVTGREFTVATGAGFFQVDTASLTYNPLDDTGFQKIDIGDRVKVNGSIDNALFDEPEISADWIIELSQ